MAHASSGGPVKVWVALRAVATLKRIGAASPGSAIALERLDSQTDVGQILPSIRVPTLVLRRRGDSVETGEGARYIAREIAGAKYVELEGVDAPPWAGDSNAIIDEIEEFLTGIRRAPEPDRDPWHLYRVVE